MNKKRKEDGKGYLTRHHLIPKERIRKRTLKQNYTVDDYEKVLRLWYKKHQYWHFLFGNLTLREIISILERIAKIKGL